MQCCPENDRKSDLSRTVLLRASARALAVLLGAQASGHAYVSENVDGHTVRCSSVSVERLPKLVRQQYNLVGASDDTAVVSCVVQQQTANGELVHKRARFSGYAQSLIGHRSPLSFRQVLEAGPVGYVATYSERSDAPVRVIVNVMFADAEHQLTLQDRKAQGPGA